MTQAFNLSQFANKVNTSGQASLTTAVSGTLPVANGGTGATTLGANGVVLGNGTSAVTTVAPSTSGNVLQSNGTTWVSASIAQFSGTQAQVFTSSGTFTIPSGITKLKVTVVGGGGGGSGNDSNTTPYNGGGGGTSTVASGTQVITTISATGGGGNIYNTGYPSSVGAGSGGDLNMNGSFDGASIFAGNIFGAASATAGRLYGGGGAANEAISGVKGAGGGGGTAIKFLTVVSGTLTVTIGNGGAGGSPNTYIGGAGGKGVVFIEW